MQFSTATYTIALVASFFGIAAADNCTAQDTGCTAVVDMVPYFDSNGALYFNYNAFVYDHSCSNIGSQTSARAPATVDIGHDNPVTFDNLMWNNGTWSNSKVGFCYGDSCFEDFDGWKCSTSKNGQGYWEPECARSFAC